MRPFVFQTGLIKLQLRKCIQRYAHKGTQLIFGMLFIIPFSLPLNHFSISNIIFAWQWNNGNVRFVAIKYWKKNDEINHCKPRVGCQYFLPLPFPKIRFSTAYKRLFIWKAVHWRRGLPTPHRFVLSHNSLPGWCWWPSDSISARRVVQRETSSSFICCQCGGLP